MEYDTLIDELKAKEIFMRRIQYWLLGGIIVSIISILPIVYGLIMGKGEEYGYLLGAIYYYVGLYNLISLPTTVAAIIINLISITFPLGALLGLLFEKIKNKHIEVKPNTLWFKTGAVFLLIVWVLAVISIYIPNIINTPLQYFYLPFGLLNLVRYIFDLIQSENSELYRNYYIASTLLYYFILGSIIGFIYSKIKNQG